MCVSVARGACVRVLLVLSMVCFSWLRRQDYCCCCGYVHGWFSAQAARMLKRGGFVAFAFYVVRACACVFPLLCVWCTSCTSCLFRCVCVCVWETVGDAGDVLCLGVCWVHLCLCLSLCLSVKQLSSALFGGRGVGAQLPQIWVISLVFGILCLAMISALVGFALWLGLHSVCAPERICRVCCCFPTGGQEVGGTATERNVHVRCVCEFVPSVEGSTRQRPLHKLIVCMAARYPAGRA